MLPLFRLLRHKGDGLLGLFLNRLAAIEQREILAVAPHLRQVAVMRALGIAGLAWMIYSPRIVPIADIDYDAHRRPTSLSEITGLVRRLARNERAAVLWNRADIDPCASGVVDNPRERMFAEVVVQLAPLPLCCIRALQPFHLFVSRPEARQ